MTEPYAQMLRFISDRILTYIDQKECDVRALNSSIVYTASNFGLFKDSELIINNQLKDCYFVSILTGLILDFLSGKRNYTNSFSDGAILSSPAFKLVRVVECRTRCDIKTKWIESGGKLLPGNKMIALKGDSIWKTISHFGFPFPPFNYCRCWEVEDVDYDTCIALHIIDDSHNWRSVVADSYNDPIHTVKNLAVFDFILKDMCESKEVKKLLRHSF